jgi:hypothetical protein
MTAEAESVLIVFDPQMPTHAIYVSASNGEVRATMSPHVELEPIDALNFDIRRAVIGAMAAHITAEQSS